MQITNAEILQIAMEQSAADLNCSAEDFRKCQPVVVISEVPPAAKRFYSRPMACNFVCYGNNVVAMTEAAYEGIVSEYVHRYDSYHCFETPSLLWLSEHLAEKGQQVCFLSEYYLPDIDKLHALSCGYALRELHREDFAGLYLPQWSNALCKDRPELDVLGIGAYDGGTLVGFAACSMDADRMWQIGVDVLPEYRRQGIASAITSSLALKIFENDRVPFYCSAWSNIRSVRNAVKSGFIPAWVEMNVKPAQYVSDLNRCISNSVKNLF